MTEGKLEHICYCVNAVIDNKSELGSIDNILKDVRISKNNKCRDIYSDFITKYYDLTTYWNGELQNLKSMIQSSDYNKFQKDYLTGTLIGVVVGFLLLNPLLPFITGPLYAIIKSKSGLKDIHGEIKSHRMLKYKVDEYKNNYEGLKNHLINEAKELIKERYKQSS